jgi:Asp-tRNA(Asn)/Glu-tRNA(Gln) amidotransferase A subunit family amidase
MDFREHRVTDLAAMVRSRTLSAWELTAAALERIEHLDPELNAWVTVDAERAFAAADLVDKRLTEGEAVGPLAGIPIGVKDLEDAEGFPTRFGSRLSDDTPAIGDSVLVARLRAAGCVVIGKTTTPEYGHKGVTESPLTGVTRNPWDTGRSPGGSSGGSAAAIASGMVPLATGSDGGGSIRIPAALCGFSGLKTTQGRVPIGGPTPPGSGILTVKGPMTRVISDTAAVLDVCVGPHPTDAFSLPRSGSPWHEAAAAHRLPSRVVWSPTLGFASVDREVAAQCEAAVTTLEEAGVEIVLLEDLWADDPLMPWYVTWATLRARAQGHLVDTPSWKQIDPSLRLQIEHGLTTSGLDVIGAIDAIHDLSLQLDRAFEQAPILLTPTCAGQAPVVGRDGTIDGEEVPGWVSFTYGFNLTRNPAGSVRCGFTSDGMPVGLQVVGRQLADVAVIQTVAALEDVFGTAEQAPTGAVGDHRPTGS